MALKRHNGVPVGQSMMFVEGEDGKPVPLKAGDLGGGGGLPPEGSITTEMFAEDAKAPFAGTADSANDVTWGNVRNRPSTFPPSSHDHNDLYYTKAEVDNLIQQLRDELGGGDGS